MYDHNKLIDSPTRIKFQRVNITITSGNNTENVKRAKLGQAETTRHLNIGNATSITIYYIIIFRCGHS